MGEETQLGASIEDLTSNLNQSSEVEVSEDTSKPEDSISRWVNPREVSRWSDVQRVEDMEQVHIYTAVVAPADADAVESRLAEGNCDVRAVYDSGANGNSRIEFEEAHCPF